MRNLAEPSRQRTWDDRNQSHAAQASGPATMACRADGTVPMIQHALHRALDFRGGSAVRSELSARDEPEAAPNAFASTSDLCADRRNRFVNFCPGPASPRP